MSVEDFSYTGGLEQLVPPVGRLLVARVMSGRWQRDTIGETRRMSRGDVCVVTQPDRPHLARWDSAVRLQIIILDPTVLLDVAAAAGDTVPRFRSLTPFSERGQRQVWNVLDDLVGSTGHPAAAKSPLIRQGAARTLAAALLEVFPNTAQRDPLVRDRIDAARSRVLRTAVGYVHDHAHEDLSVADLAAAAGVSRQAVHLTFRQHLQTTPGDYLERVRLDRAHRDLSDLDPGSATVEQVARLWGFDRADRFRRCYTSAYGVAPETTLGSGPDGSVLTP